MPKKNTTALILLFFVPVFLYVNTLKNDYALDDSIVFTENIYVQKGIRGIPEILSHETFTGFFKEETDLVEGGRYRPLSLLSFAIEYELWGLNPGVSHAVNVLLFGLLCAFLFIFLKELLSYFGLKDQAFPVAFLSTLLFAVHPIHTEVVSNIKGRDELLSLLFALATMLTLIRYPDRGGLLKGATLGACSFMALMAKESALSLVVVCPGIVLINYKRDLKIKHLYPVLYLFAGTAFYLFIRFKYAGGFSGSVSMELLNNPYLHASSMQKYSTIIYTFGLYLKLLFFPHPLTCDYYPWHIELQSFTSLHVMLSLGIHLFLLSWAVFSFIKKKKIWAFVILFYFITLLPVSNLFVNTGSIMNERFIFSGSVGFSLGLGYLMYIFMNDNHGRDKLKKYVAVAFLLLLTGYSVKTVIRNTHWKDNLTLFLHDVKISENSAKCNCMAGGILLETALKESDIQLNKSLLDQSVVYLQKALRIYPDYVDALLLLGNAYFRRDHDFEKVLMYYGRIFSLQPGHSLACSNLNLMLRSGENPRIRQKGYSLILLNQPDNYEANYQLGVTHGKMLNQPDSAVFYLLKAHKVKPESVEVNRDLGVAYAISDDYENALPYLEKVRTLAPNQFVNYINLGITYRRMGQTAKANQMFLKAEELKEKSKK